MSEVRIEHRAARQLSKNFLKQFHAPIDSSALASGVSSFPKKLSLETSHCLRFP
jgi:hypothetical protein